MLHKHHIIPLHTCTTCPRDKKYRRKHKMGVCPLQVPSNLVYLTIEEHAATHKKLYEEHGRSQDDIAYRMLSGQISAKEAIIESIKKANTGRKHTVEHIAKIKISKIGVKPKYRSNETRAIAVLNGKRLGKNAINNEKSIAARFKPGNIISEQKRIQQSLLMKDVPKTDIQKRKMSESKLKLWENNVERKNNYSDRLKGKGNPQFGKMWITNGIESKTISKEMSIPEGYTKGRIVIR